MNCARHAELMDAARARVDDMRRLQAAGLICDSGDFFPSVHYPPITMYPPITEQELFATYTPPPDGLFDVYAHLPFCQGRCLFCHYPVMYGEKLEEKDRYLSALEKEMDIYMRRLGLDKIRTRSILVGGGTPTYLTPPQLRRFLDFFCKRLDLTRCQQFNYDVDPVTMSGPDGIERLSIMRDYGVNRLTIGIQSLDEGILKIMNRPHGVKAAYESIENSLRFGFQTNIEFIFGHPGQTMENWIDVVEKAVVTGVEEIQLYRLKVDAYGDFQGPIKKYKQIKPAVTPTPDEAIMMKQLAIDILADHGYHENIRRVFSKEKKHFSLYAHDQCCNLYDEIGLGLTAFSSLRDRFGLNTQHFEEYYSAIDENRLPLNRGLVRNRDQQIRWSMILPLKNRFVRGKLFQRRTGADLGKVFPTKIARLREHGLVDMVRRGDEMVLTLTRLGAFFADEVAEEFHDPSLMPFPRNSYAHGPLYPYDFCGLDE